MTDKENTSVRLTSARNGGGKPFGHQKKALQPAPTVMTNGPILLCQSSSDPLMLGFGCVEVHTEAERSINVFNPHRSSCAEVQISGKHHSSKKGLSVSFGNAERVKVIPPMMSDTLYIKWKPDAVTSLAEQVELKMNSSVTLNVTVTGVAALGKVVLKVDASLFLSCH